MPLYGRKRDFTPDTTTFIQDNLRTVSLEDSNVFAAWCGTYGQYFDGDYSGRAAVLDEALTMCRRITYTAARDAVNIPVEVCVDCDLLAAQVNSTNDRLDRYIAALKTFRDSIQVSRSGFSSGFDMESRRIVLEQRLGSDYLERMRMRRVMMEEFGFDSWTASFMCRLYEELREQNPDYSQTDLDWLFIRLLSCAGGDYSSFTFNNTMGNPLGGQSLEDYLVGLGFSREDARRFEFELSWQHVVTGNPELYDVVNIVGNPDHSGSRDEFIERYNAAYGTSLSWPEDSQEIYRLLDAYSTRYANGQTADFTHQMATMAAYLGAKTDLCDQTLAINGSTWVLDTRLFYNQDGSAVYPSLVILEAAGWLGDAVGTNITKPSMDNDDYIADLDSVNIMALYSRGGYSSIGAAMSDYYSNHDPRENRAVDFRRNSNNLLGDFYRVTDASGASDFAELQTKNPTGYYFLLSVWSGSPDLLDAGLVAEREIDEQAFHDAWPY